MKLLQKKQMKLFNKWKWIFLLSCWIWISGLQSCDKDNDPASIRGTWQLVELTGSAEMYATSHFYPYPDTALINRYTFICSEINVLLTFDLNTNEHNEMGTYTETRTIDSMGIISTQVVNLNINDDRTWFAEGDTLFFDSNFYPEFAEITELNKSQLSLKEKIDYYLIGASTHFISTEYRTYKKVK
jgi:hypothetical protein